MWRPVNLSEQAVEGGIGHGNASSWVTGEGVRVHCFRFNLLEGTGPERIPRVSTSKCPLQAASERPFESPCFWRRCDWSSSGQPATPFAYSEKAKTLRNAVSTKICTSCS